MKRLFCFTLCILIAVTAFAACSGTEEHVHTFADGWQYNESEHWHDATCEHDELTSDKGVHVDSDNNDICDVCGYIKDHQHTYETEMSWDETSHFYKATCGHDVKKDSREHEDKNNDSVCDVCRYDYNHTHTYSTEWTATEGGHWRAPLCDHNIDGMDKEAHKDDDNDGKCDVCGDMDGHTHIYSDTWSVDGDCHWKEPTCDHTIAVADKGVHADSDNDGKCDICNNLFDHFHSFNSTWMFDEKGHWHQANCGHGNVKGDETAHFGYEEDGICDICGYGEGHLHIYSSEWTATDGGHWRAPICGHNIDGMDKEEHKDDNDDGACDACGDMGGHTHTYSDTWSMNADNHWKEPTCSHVIGVVDKNAHNDLDNDNKCDVCGYQLTHFHSFDTAWTSDASGHWHKATCDHSDARSEEAPHSGYDEDGVCDVCQYAVFRFYTVKIIAPDFISLYDTADNAIEKTITVKEGTELIFKMKRSDDVQLYRIQGAEEIGEPTHSAGNYIHTVKITVNADSEITVFATKVDVIQDMVTDGEGVIECEKVGFYYAEIKFTAEKAGKYAIYCLSSSDISFAKTKEGEHSSYLIFDVEVPGEVTLSAKYFSWNKKPETVDFTYYIGIFEDNLVLPELEGSGLRFPMIIPVHVTINLPKAGLYQITSSNNLCWDNDVSVPHFIYAPTDNYNICLEVSYPIESYPVNNSTYDFDWSVKYLDEEAKKLGEGENEIVVMADNLTKYTFTAPKAGEYYFTADSEYTVFRTAWDFDYEYLPTKSGTFRVTLEAGETVAYYSGISWQNENPADYNDKLTIVYRGFSPENMAADDESILGYNVPTNTLCGFFGWENDYNVYLPNGGSISFDGGETWHTNTHILVDNSEYGITYMVKGDTDESEVKVCFEPIVFEFTIDAESEDNKFTMIPGQEYTVFLTSEGNEMLKNYQLTWEDSNITVTYKGNQFTSGVVDIVGLPSYNGQNYITITYNGADPTEVLFTLEKVVE